jgi:hypothetical protein
MTKRDIITLLAPSIVFATVGICAFIISQSIQRHADIEHTPEHQQKFDTFVTNVVSGKWQLTTDRWLVVLRSTERVAESERVVNADAAVEVRDFVWLAAIGIFWQVAAVFIVKRRLRQP